MNQWICNFDSKRWIVPDKSSGEYTDLGEASHILQRKRNIQTMTVWFFSLYTMAGWLLVESSIQWGSFSLKKWKLYFLFKHLQPFINQSTIPTFCSRTSFLKRPYICSSFFSGLQGSTSRHLRIPVTIVIHTGAEKELEGESLHLTKRFWMSHLIAWRPSIKSEGKLKWVRLQKVYFDSILHCKRNGDIHKAPLFYCLSEFKHKHSEMYLCSLPLHIIPLNHLTHNSFCTKRID